MQPQGSDVILPSCFDGIGASAFVLSSLVGKLFMFVAWEIDPECVQKHFPDVLHRGDFMDDRPSDVIKLVCDADPSATKTVVMASAPPCPDISCIRSDAPGLTGPEGQKFTSYCRFVREIEKGIQPRRVLRLVENVVLGDKGEADFFSVELGCQAELIDAADVGLVGRPRLWWGRIPWLSAPTSPFTGKPLQWLKNQRYHQVHGDAALQRPESLELGGLALHPKVAAHECRLPCFTAPAPTEAGRAAPKKMKGRLRPEVKSRWLCDARTLAPWHCTQEALLRDPSGSLVRHG